MKDRCYFISGWGFDSSLGVFSGPLLDYMQYPNRSIAYIVEQFSREVADQSVVVAWSLGGLFAIKLAATFPRKIKKLVLLASQPRFLVDRNWAGISQKNAANFLLRAGDNMEHLTTYFLNLCNFPNVNAFLKVPLAQSLIVTNENTLLYFLKLMFRCDYRDEYRAIQVPILHLIGGKDVVLKQDDNDLQQLNTNTQVVVIDQAGHAGFLSHKEDYKNRIGEFLTYE